MEMESGFQEWLRNRAKNRTESVQHEQASAACTILCYNVSDNTIFRIRNKHGGKFLRALNALRKNNRSSLLLNKPD